MIFETGLLGMIIAIKNTEKGAWFALGNFCYDHLKVLLRYLIVKNGEERIIHYQLVSSFFNFNFIKASETFTSR